VEQEKRGIEWINAQFRQILIDYPGLSGFRKLRISEIRFFYEPLIPGLVEQQILAKKNKKTE